MPRLLRLHAAITVAMPRCCLRHHAIVRHFVTPPLRLRHAGLGHADYAWILAYATPRLSLRLRAGRHWSLIDTISYAITSHAGAQAE